MFVILKPEMTRRISSLDPYLADAGFEIDSRHSIQDWHGTACKIYAPQMRDPTFNSEFNVYLWMTKEFFGNSAVAYQLSREGSLEENLADIRGVKSTFRNYVSNNGDSAISFMVNLDRLEIPQRVQLGKKGQINIGDSPLEEGGFDGRWDYFFFKYIHTSDNPEAHEREEGILRDFGVYDSALTEEQWNQMIDTRTLTPLRDPGRYTHE